MFAPKKMIPKLAVAMLALTGCGGDGNNGTGGSGGSGATGGTGGSGGSGATGGSGGSRGLPEGINNFCLKIAQCYMIPAQQCLNYFEPYQEFYDRISEACFNLYGTYYQCLADLSCDVIMNSTPAELEALCYADLQDMWAQVCPP